jgi:hypothetical protein
MTPQIAIGLLITAAAAWYLGWIMRARYDNTLISEYQKHLQNISQREMIWRDKWTELDKHTNTLFNEEDMERAYNTGISTCWAKTDKPLTPFREWLAKTYKNPDKE